MQFFTCVLELIFLVQTCQLAFNHCFKEVDLLGLKLFHHNVFIYSNAIHHSAAGNILNTLSASYEYSRSNGENVPLQIQIKLS